jgi:hypothetical protein
MTDRELTEAAARAAGFPMRAGTPGEFSPLTTDSDAFRLMVALNLRASPTRLSRGKIDRIAIDVPGLGHLTEIVMYEGDARAAWRRAIVLTAAALDAENQTEGEQP